MAGGGGSLEPSGIAITGIEQSLYIFQPTERCVAPGVVPMIPMCGTIKGLAPLGPSLSPLSPRQRARLIQQDCCNKTNLTNSSTTMRCRMASFNMMKAHEIVTDISLTSESKIKQLREIEARGEICSAPRPKAP